MNERSRIATSVRMSEYANKKYRSRSSSATKENKKPTSVLIKHTPGERPLAYTNAALSVETIPDTSIQPTRCSQLDNSCPDLLSATVEDAVRKVLGGSLHDLHQDVNRIQKTLSEIALKMAESKRIAIIGAGPCGLTAAKGCLEEGLDVVVYDKTDNIGGLWCYRDYDLEGLPSVMKSTVINTSKEMSAFSDFPPPAHFPNFMHNTLMFQYFKMYAEKFGVLRHVQLMTEVLQITQSDDYEKTGRWKVTTRRMKDSVTNTEEFDGVLIATGHHTSPLMPDFPGLKSFKGNAIHTHSLKKAAGYEDKVVLVVGIGNSAVDAAVEISTVAKQVYLSTRRGAWLFQRVGPDGKPFDAAYTRRCLDTVNKIVPFSLSCWFMEHELNKRFDHAAYGLKPKHRVLSQHPTINDALPNKLLSGTVILREDIKCFTENGVIFKDDEQPIEIDAVVFATGYKIEFPLVGGDVIRVKDNKVQLYKYMFPPHLPHPSLAVMACVQVIGAVFPVAELQGRWYASIMSGKKKLPSKEIMQHDIKLKEKQMKERYVSSPRHTVQVDYISYSDELAELVGCKPDLWKIFFTDPKLFWALFNGPSLPYQYRLTGPHPWSGARAAILGYNSRVLAALNTRKSSE
ncbi:flavin-containing monooxygenase 5-like isoform X1 [Argiope bruennichi]|uniref:Flavin-containing monooxygenase n=2 Tax=Argiope bruennichi TaxID=94029 RepID=A0A8T0FJ22_ARGBR|nr:flavin-containing monooxygenase 5-like isoform X1 [Argiope bruennichi]KAF8791267.1 Dimethylaniline monooxygenase [N-oxide-forming] like protein [Argiope bruennichi]